MTELVAFQTLAEEINALAVLEGGAVLTKTGLDLPANIEVQRYAALGEVLDNADDCIQWAFGDWYVYGEDVFPEEHSQVWERMSVDPHKAMQYIRVARAIPKHARRPALKWTHHRTVYTMEPEARDHWLLRAENEGWTATRLADEVRDARSASANGSLPAPSRSYVLERVSDAAEAVWKAAERDGEFFRVPADQFALLGEALGVELA